jgi:hypothetical protein
MILDDRAGYRQQRPSRLPQGERVLLGFGKSGEW